MKDSTILSGYVKCLETTTPLRLFSNPRYSNVICITNAFASKLKAYQYPKLGINMQTDESVIFSVRRTTDAHLEAIHTWLVEEEAQGVHGNFLCNWSVIEKCHKKRELLVCIDERINLPVSFQLGGLIYPGILQIRQSYRGTGIGRKMVEYCFALAIKKNEYLLRIQCKPSTSIPFWRRMGFELTEQEDGRNYACKILRKLLKLPKHGDETQIVIRFFPQSINWDPETMPFLVQSPVAKLSASNIVYLTERVFFHEGMFNDARDVVVEIEIDGIRRYLSKAKYEESSRIGVSRCTNGYYIDKVAVSRL